VNCICVFTSRSYVKLFDLMEISLEILLHYILMQHLYKAVLFWKFLLCMLLDLHIRKETHTSVQQQQTMSLVGLKHSKYFFLPKSIFEKFFMYLVVVQSQKEICYGHVPNLDN